MIICNSGFNLFVVGRRIITLYNLAIIDDEAIILNGLCKYYPWESLGFAIVYKTDNSKDFLDQIRNGLKIDVLLCDIAMPNYSGIDIIKILYANFPEIIVVFLSGYADFNYAQYAVRYNVFEYLLKPVKLNELMTTFSKIKLKLDERNKIHKPQLSYSASIVSKIQDIAKKNINNVSRKFIATEIKLSSNYLSSLYKKQTGENLNTYLIRLKMETAMNQLRNTEMKIYQISEMLGYTNPKNFSRAFKLFWGEYPRDVRSK